MCATFARIWYCHSSAFFLFNFSPSNRKVIASHYGINFYFLHDSFCSTSFHELVICMYYLMKYMLNFFAHGFLMDFLRLESSLLLLRIWEFLFLRLEGSLWIWDVSPLLDRCFANIFYQCVVFNSFSSVYWKKVLS